MKEFLLSELESSSNSNSKNAGLRNPQQWKTLSDEWRSDADVALAALTANVVRICDLSPEQQDDAELLREAVAANPRQWYHLPYHFKNLDVEFVRCVTHFPNKTLVESVMRQFPELQHDAHVWDVVLDSEQLSQTVKDELLAEFMKQQDDSD